MMGQCLLLHTYLFIIGADVVPHQGLLDIRGVVTETKGSQELAVVSVEYDLLEDFPAIPTKTLPLLFFLFSYVLLDHIDRAKTDMKRKEFKTYNI